MIYNFDYFFPTKVFFGKGQIAKIPSEIPAGSKVLIIYGGGTAKKLGILDQVKEKLRNFETGEFGGIGSNPEYDKLMKAIPLIRKEKYDFLLAVGGGSVIDGTKFISAAVDFEGGDPWKLLSEHAPIKTAIPFGAVLTIPATGSEMNAGAVISRKSMNGKLGFGHARLFPVFSVMDPTYTFSLPPRQIGNGIVDTFVHVLEQYLTFPVNGKIQDRFAEGILLTLIEEGPKALEMPENYDVRANLMWAAGVALSTWISVGVPGDWAAHKLGHALTLYYGMDHGRTMGIVYPALMKVMKEPKRAKLLQYAERVWGITGCAEDVAIDEAIARTAGFFESIGVPTHLSAYNIGAEAVNVVADNLMHNELTAIGEDGIVRIEDVVKIMEAAL